jgi:mannose-6-phosphate isomerase-like protein (cupin superfamily)
MTSDADRPIEAVVVDLGSAVSGSGGAVWNLPHGGELDANLIRLDADAIISEHVNSEVDVLLFVHSGTGQITVDGSNLSLGADSLALIPRGVSRAIAAGPAGITYLSVHRRRGPMTITQR